VRGAGVGQEPTGNFLQLQDVKAGPSVSWYEMEARPVVTHAAGPGVEKTETASLVRPNVRGTFHRNTRRKEGSRSRDEGETVV
jgi:hypothetical protein